MTLAERTIKTQHDTLKSLNNYKFTHGGYEYRLTYNGGVAEFISIYGRRIGADAYRYVDGFNGYPFYTKDEAIAEAKKRVSKT